VGVRVRVRVRVEDQTTRRDARAPGRSGPRAEEEEEEEEEEKRERRRRRATTDLRTLSVTGRSASTTRGPIVMFGTKRPSMTSMWIHSAPASSTALTCARGGGSAGGGREGRSATARARNILSDRGGCEAFRHVGAIEGSTRALP